MIRALISGRIFKSAEAKTSAGGKAYATASLSLDAPEGQPRFCRITAFGDVATRLQSLGKGEAIAVSGRLEVSLWTPAGKPAEAQVRMLVDELITVRDARKAVA